MWVESGLTAYSTQKAYSMLIDRSLNDIQASWKEECEVYSEETKKK